jgi:glucose-6-phosphate dehydrogenase assembly protein OpcA
MPNQPLVMAVASYPSTSAAGRDFEAVWQASRARELSRVATALLKKGADGQLTIDSHDNTAKDLSWGGALLGGPLTVIATPLGIQFLVSMMTSTNEWASVGVIAGRFWNDIPREQLRQMADLLEARQAAVVVVAVEQDRDAIRALLTHAITKVVTESIWADLETDSPRAIEEPGTSD